MKTDAAQAWSLLESAELLCPAGKVDATVERLASQITSRLRDCQPVVLGVMRGSVIFAGRLLPLLRFPLEFDYLEVTRYAGSTRGGPIQWKVSPGTTVKDRVVLVLDDILDQGYTLATIRERLLEAGARELYTAVFADKNIGTEKPVKPDFVGIEVPNRYVFGFGMDVYGMWRNLPAVYALKDDGDG